MLYKILGDSYKILGDSSSQQPSNYDMSHSINPDGQLTDSDNISANQDLATVLQTLLTSSPQQVCT